MQPPTPPDDLSPNNPNGCPCSHNAAMKPSASSSTAFDSQTTNSDHTSVPTEVQTTLDENENTSDASSATNWKTTTTTKQLYCQSELQRQPLSLNQCCSRSMKTTTRANTIDCSMDQQHQQQHRTNPFGCSSGTFKHCANTLYKRNLA